MNDLVKKDQDQGGLIPHPVGKESGLAFPELLEGDIYLSDSRAAGTSHVEGVKEIGASFQEGDHLAFYREPENSHDPQAIRIGTVRKKKTGYVPRQDNVVFSRLMDAGKILLAKIMEKEMEGIWSEVKIEIHLYEGQERELYEGIIFQEKDKRLELDITDYQYEDYRGLGECDSNWAMVRVSYPDLGLSLDFTDPCLLNFELKEFADEIQELELTETGLIKKFIESYLFMAITKIDNDFTFQIRLVYEMTKEGWEEAYICQKFDLQGLRNLNNEFRNLYNKFPLRK